MDPSNEMCKSLVKWLQSLVSNKTRNVQEICSGEAIVEALIQICPETFNKLDSKIKKDAGTNWRLRISNLKKINQAVIEYYQDVLALQMLEIVQPDVNAIGENNDPVQLAKLLRLVLGCAINCERKQEYITKIMELEEMVQQSIMQAIQQLEEVTDGPGKSGLSLMLLDNDSRVRLTGELDAANNAKETLSQHCQQLEMQIQQLIEEKQAIVQENDDLKSRESKNKDVRKQIDVLKDELFKAEALRDDFKSKIREQDKQLLIYQEKIAELQIEANAAGRLKDEVDAMKESVDKVQNLELTLSSYKKKLEKYSDMKKNVQKLEEKNMEYLEKTMQLEEQKNSNNVWKTQCDSFKTQVGELQQKIDEETSRADRAEFTLQKLETKLVALNSEKERLAQERNSLKEEIEEIRLGKTVEKSGAAVSQELTPTEMNKRLRFLEKENQSLRTTNQELTAKQTLLDSSLTRIEKLQQQNRSLNQTILNLEAQIEEKSSNEPPVSSESKDLKVKIASLQELLASKTEEVLHLQAKHTRYLEKTKEVSQSLDIKSNGAISLPSSPSAQNSQRSHMKEAEERLITTAFYKLGINCHREAMEERIAALSGGQGQSFLSRQRQATPRKPLPKYKPSPK